MENSLARDEHDRKVVAKGGRDTPFMISYKSAKNVERQEHKRTMMFIYGGGALAIASLAAIFYSLGLL